MSKTFIDKACAVVPEFENRIYRFDKKLRIAQYAEHSIYDYKLKIAQAALYLQKKVPLIWYYDFRVQL